MSRLATDLARALPLGPRHGHTLSLTPENGPRVVSLPGTESTIRAYSAVHYLTSDIDR